MNLTEELTRIEDLPADAIDQIKAGSVTYRGTEMDGGWLLKIRGEEYHICDALFDRLRSVGTIAFSAPYRNHV
jgi:hypothetical protein